MKSQQLDSEIRTVGLEMYREVIGKSKDVQEMGEFDKFTIDHLFANVWSRSSELFQPTDEWKVTDECRIALKERSMITVAILAAQGRTEELKTHIKAALNLGIGECQIYEIMIHVAHYAGWPAGHSGTKIAADIFESRKADNELRELNLQIGIKEAEGDKEFFEKYLADDLIFRRASEKVVTKKEFIQGLKSDQFDILETDISGDINLYGDHAVTNVKIKAKRKSEDSPGEYMNIRTFIKRGNIWQLSLWLNTKIQAEQR